MEKLKNILKLVFILFWYETKKANIEEVRYPEINVIHYKVYKIVNILIFIEVNILIQTFNNQTSALEDAKNFITNNNLILNDINIRSTNIGD